MITKESKLDAAVIGLGFGATIFVILALNEVASAIKSVAKAMEERNRIERKKMELQGLEAKKQGAFSDEVDKIVQRPY